ncbi:S8 family serine peptidase [Deinococcus altitudinis]|uniref:S8 family serine peptidase n=1 Tax=Deinococcus altitudinis TaxID=468914 RepID=UPI0038912E7A
MALAAGLVLVGCTPPATPDLNVLRDQTVTLGYGLSAQVQQPFTGTWTIEGLPSWLTATPTSGTDDVNTVLTADRRVAAPGSAAQAALTGEVKLNWTAREGAVGSATLKVGADLYRLSGQVQGSAASLGLGRQDVGQQGAAQAQPNPASAGRLRVGEVRAGLPVARGVIVAYRSQAARVQAMKVLTGAAAPAAAQTSTQTSAQVAAPSVPGERVRSAAGQTLTLSTPDVQATLARLRAQPEVAYAVPDAVFSALGLNRPAEQDSGRAAAAQQLLAAPLNPADEYAPLQWAYRLLGYPAVWRDMQQRPYTRAVTVAVLDTGVRYDHPDLKGQLYGPGDGALDLLAATDGNGAPNGDGDGPDTDPTDPATPGRTDISHGTHVTGIIVADWGTFAPPCPGCSGSGVVGASYTAPVKVLPVRVLDAPAGSGSESDIALALLYAAGDPVTLGGGQAGSSQTYTNPHPAAVINLSLGGPLTDSLQIKVICDAVARATDLGALVVAAAGNFGGSAPIYPAACPGAVSVASVSLSETAVPQHAYYSDRYPQVALSAPGGNPGTGYNGGTLNGQPMPDEILSTGWNYAGNLPAYYLEAGTSQAAPQVAALAALLLSKGTVTTAGAALARMVATATDLGAAGRDDTYGAGLINPVAALGAPAVSNALGLTLQDDRGRSYQPALDSVGRFTAYLPDGRFRALAGRDSNGNGLAGETGEPRVERSVTLGPTAPTSDLGVLTP